MAQAAAGPASTASPTPSASTSTTARPPTIIPSPRKSSRLAVHHPPLPTSHHNAPATALASSSSNPLAGSPPSTPPPRRRKGKQPLRNTTNGGDNDHDLHDNVDDDDDRSTVQTARVAGVGGTTAGLAVSNARHSHGLSWSSTTRDSVVDNLLFSLDNLSRGDVSQEGHQEQQEVERQRFLSSLTSQFDLSRPAQRPRGHTHSSSISDLDRSNMDSSPASKFSLSTKGRRSNSSSNFGLSAAFGGRGKSGKGRESSDTQRPAIGNANIANSTRESESIDGGPGITLESSGSAWPSGNALNMDYVHAEEGAAESPTILGRGRPVPSIHSRYEGANNDHDAAPEPFVAAGPRKMQNPLGSGPVYVDAADSRSKSSALRKTTTQTDLRSAMSSPSPPIPQDVRNQAADFVRSSGTRGMVASTSAQGNAGTAAPAGSRNRNPSPPRERPGFFKRVFGSSRAVSAPVDRPVSSHVPQESSHRSEATPRSTAQASGTQPNDDAKQGTGTVNIPKPPLPPPPPPPQLNKKPSSFFRRRKKSTSGTNQPPPVPSVINTTLNAKAAEPSPSISSLRKVMDPFLNQAEPGLDGTHAHTFEDLRPGTAASYVEDSEDPDIFHTGYTPQRHPFSRDHILKPSGPEPVNGTNDRLKMKKRPDPLATSSTVRAGEDHRVSQLDRSTSVDTVRDSPYDAPKVSPLTESPPRFARSQSSISRPSVVDVDPPGSAAQSPGFETGIDMRAFSAGTNVSVAMDDESWLVTKSASVERPISKRSERLRLQPTPSEERLNLTGNRERLSPTESSTRSSSIPHNNLVPGAAYSGTAPQLTASSIPTVSVDPSHTAGALSLEIVDEGAEYRERARKIFDGDEEDVSSYEAAAWMGERNTLSTRTLHAYMQLFDFSGLNILAALRLLCGKLMLRGETQQFDRIITALSARWCECNPFHGFKAQDVVHTIVYSLVLLNTDLHLADIDEKMSRSAYVKNTLPTIKRVVIDAAPNAFDDTLRPATQSTRPSAPWAGLDPSAPTSPILNSTEPSAERLDSSHADVISARRLSMRPGVSRLDSDNTPTDSAAGGPLLTLVGSPWMGSLRGWEVEIEAILKSFFTSIRSEPLPLLGAMTGALPPGNRNLSVADLNNPLKRTGSVISRAPSDSMSFRSKQDLRSMTMRWQGRGNRGRPKVYPASTVGSSRTSFDDGSGFWSPAQSSKYSFSKTLTSASVGSFNHFSPTESFKHSIGFANALSQAIIREEAHGNDTETFSVPGGLLEDESLALEGAPWAKEGMVKHKHHMEVEGRKAKDRNWTDCFAVLSKGKLTLFNFNTSSKSQTIAKRNHFQRSGKAASVTGARVGGGDWMENAEQLDVLILRQTIASTLPPPGYSKARPHVWALSLPSGAVHLFQVGTPEIAAEFMSAANYWSARLSKEPLAGGVSNIEYGWSDNVVNTALVGRTESFAHPPSSLANRSINHGHSMSTDRPRRSSLQSSMRSSFDTGFGSTKVKLPGDKAHVVEWQPPTQSMMASQLMEVDQLKQLTAYVQSQEEELEKHNELKHAIELAFSPRHSNHNKALTNWQRKSDYLLREIVKFRTYIDSLTAAQKAKEAVYAKKADGRPLSPVAKDEDVRDSPVAMLSTLTGDTSLRRDIHTSG